MMGEGRDGYRDQIVTCDVGFSLHSKTHPLFMKYSNGTSTQCYVHTNIPVIFLQSLYVPFHLLVYNCSGCLPILPYITKFHNHYNMVLYMYCSMCIVHVLFLLRSETQ